jgi:hypothetical protein
MFATLGAWISSFAAVALLASAQERHDTLRVRVVGADGSPRADVPLIIHSALTGVVVPEESAVTRADGTAEFPRGDRWLAPEMRAKVPIVEIDVPLREPVSLPLLSKDVLARTTTLTLPPTSELVVRVDIPSSMTLPEPMTPVLSCFDRALGKPRRFAGVWSGQPLREARFPYVGVGLGTRVHAARLDGCVLAAASRVGPRESGRVETLDIELLGARVTDTWLTGRVLDENGAPWTSGALRVALGREAVSRRGARVARERAPRHARDRRRLRRTIRDEHPSRVRFAAEHDASTDRRRGSRNASCASCSPRRARTESSSQRWSFARDQFANERVDAGDLRLSPVPIAACGLARIAYQPFPNARVSIFERTVARAGNDSKSWHELAESVTSTDFGRRLRRARADRRVAASMRRRHGSRPVASTWWSSLRKARAAAPRRSGAPVHAARNRSRGPRHGCARSGSRARAGPIQRARGVDAGPGDLACRAVRCRWQVQLRGSPARRDSICACVRSDAPIRWSSCPTFARVEGITS